MLATWWSSTLIIGERILIICMIQLSFQIHSLLFRQIRVLELRTTDWLLSGCADQTTSDQSKKWRNFHSSLRFSFPLEKINICTRSELVSRTANLLHLLLNKIGGISHLRSSCSRWWGTELYSLVFFRSTIIIILLWNYNSLLRRNRTE